MRLFVLILIIFSWAKAEPQQEDQDLYGEEYYYQEYGSEDDLGYYNYNDEYDDSGASREYEPYPYPVTTTTTTTTRRTTTMRRTTTTRRPYYTTTTRAPYYITTTRYQLNSI